MPYNRDPEKLRTLIQQALASDEVREAVARVDPSGARLAQALSCRKDELWAAAVSEAEEVNLTETRLNEAKQILEKSLPPPPWLLQVLEPLRGILTCLVLAAVVGALAVLGSYGGSAVAEWIGTPLGILAAAGGVLAVALTVAAFIYYGTLTRRHEGRRDAAEKAKRQELGIAELEAKLPALAKAADDAVVGKGILPALRELVYQLEGASYSVELPRV